MLSAQSRGHGAEFKTCYLHSLGHGAEFKTCYLHSLGHGAEFKCPLDVSFTLPLYLSHNPIDHYQDHW